MSMPTPPDPLVVGTYEQHTTETKGSGTEEDPYVLDWEENDARNPQNFSAKRKWFIVAVVAMATFAVGFSSSAYSGAISEIEGKFHYKEVVITLGISLFVLGFALGPLLWAPLSEEFGRSRIFIISYIPFIAFGGGCGGIHNITGLLVFRFLQGTFGSSALVNPAGIIADMFDADRRGLAIGFFASMPFLGPVIGPIVGGYLGEYTSYPWVFYLMAILGGVTGLVHVLLVPETYAPFLLNRAANEKSKETGKFYVAKHLAGKPKQSLRQKLKITLARPIQLLFLEPIVLSLSLYIAIVYGILYLEFTAFPIVFQQERGWTPGQGGLAFIGIGVGIFLGIALNFWFNARYIRIAKREGGVAPPENRLEMMMVGGVLLPIGLFWFAWTTYPSVQFIVPILATIPFGCGIILLFLSVMNYLVDAYLEYAASALAANALLRSMFGFAFPLFGPYMYHNLGTQWASSLVAFLALACVPLPFLFYRYGADIRNMSTRAPPDPYAAMKARQLQGEEVTVRASKQARSGDAGQHQREGDDEATLNSRPSTANDHSRRSSVTVPVGDPSERSHGGAVKTEGDVGQKCS
ncbi:MFS general substrate transporter [Neolentinus lepideus HHB14362 ss-1]|uniref:MFS general substrate transporter n=1 Tax=Neolentinus lepideus HHB14362 ss-1 TaxID=1314782 RepID=A0A165VW06_9AGAM|nr:MFS general substrate transporter [Neolentinus lepideus HHB14362 ss-1]